MNRRRPWALGVALSVVLGCAPSWKELPHARVYQRAEAPILHRKPAGGFTPSDWWDFGLHGVVVPLAKSLSPARWLAGVAGNLPALDINEFGKVPDSVWFENRITRRRLSPDELLRGPNQLGPPPVGPLRVLSGKTEGSTPGLVLQDDEGGVWFVKFDPPAFREMSTGAELVASKFLHAAGYWVPETYIIQLDVSRLVLVPGAWTRDEYNRKIPLTSESLATLVAHMNPDQTGRLRTLFSRSVPGDPLGPFSYRGVRAGDPNDLIPHQRRRSLRGLWVLVAWLNNTDVRRQNTLDTFLRDGPDGRGYIRHYLIDFGDSLGAAGDREKYKGEGYEARLDWSRMFTRGLALGFLYPYWQPLKRSPYRAVGLFEAELFQPSRWVPVVENPAFSEATRADTFWGASILARFSREDIAAVVASAEYSEEGAADYITEVLVERRRKLLRYAFRDMIGIDEPSVSERYTVSFVDLEVLGGLRTEDSSSFDYEVRWNRTGRGDRIVARGVVRGAPRFDLRGAVGEIMAKEREGFSDDPYLTLSIRRSGGSPRVELHLRVVKSFLLPVSLWRQEGSALAAERNLR